MNKEQTVTFTKDELLDLLAECNNVIMDGTYSGDNMIQAVELMYKLTELHKVISEDGTEVQLTSELIPEE